MKITQITDDVIASDIRKLYYTFEVPPDTAVLIHELEIDGEVVGYVATEDYKSVGGPHLYVYPVYHTRHYLSRLSELTQTVYYPMMKAHGFKWLITNCDQSDRGTIDFLTANGFSIKKIVVAEYAL